MTASHTLRALLAVAFASAALITAPVMAAPTISLTGPSTAAANGHLTLTVAASGFTDLYAYQFDLSYNPASFSLLGIAEGSFLHTGGSTFFDGGTNSIATGTISFVFDSLIGTGPGVNGSGSLATVTFNIGSSFAGIGNFGLSNVMALDSSLNTINATVTGINVSAVPEPSALALCLAGLGIVVGGARLKRRARGDAIAA